MCLKRIQSSFLKFSSTLPSDGKQIFVTQHTNWYRTSKLSITCREVRRKSVFCHNNIVYLMCLSAYFCICWLKKIINPQESGHNDIIHLKRTFDGASLDAWSFQDDFLRSVFLHFNLSSGKQKRIVHESGRSSLSSFWSRFPASEFFSIIQVLKTSTIWIRFTSSSYQSKEIFCTTLFHRIIYSFIGYLLLGFVMPNNLQPDIAQVCLTKTWCPLGKSASFISLLCADLAGYR